MTICLFVIGIIGTVCQLNAPPIGICTPVGDDVIYCTAEIEQVPAWASYYNPAEGGINCDVGGDCAFLGDGTPTEEGYGRFAACPLGMYGRFLTFEHAGTWQCRDHGGAVNVRYGRRYTPDGFVNSWQIIIDFLLYEPEWWTYNLLDISEVR